MSLLDEFSKDCVMLVKTRMDDPLGGYKMVWVNGVHFTAAWEYQSAPEVEVAEREGVERTYNIYVDKTLNLDFHEVFKRTDNGQIYRVTNPGTDRHTPSFSSLNRQLVTVEKWELPDGEESEDDVQGSGGA